MKIEREQIRADVMKLLNQLSEDWEYEEAITEDTYFITGMGLQSLDVVILGTSTQEHYGQPLPFTQLFADIGQRPIKDLTVGEWVDFLYENLSDGQPQPQGEKRMTS